MLMRKWCVSFVDGDSKKVANVDIKRSKVGAFERSNGFGIHGGLETRAIGVFEGDCNVHT